MLVLFLLFRLSDTAYQRGHELLHVGPTALRAIHLLLGVSKNSHEIQAHLLDVVVKIEGSQLRICWESRGITPGKVVAFRFFWSYGLLIIGSLDVMSTLPWKPRVKNEQGLRKGVTNMSKVFEFGKWEGQHLVNNDNPWHNNKSFEACPLGDCHFEAFQAHKAQLVTTRILKYCEPHRGTLSVCFWGTSSLTKWTYCPTLETHDPQFPRLPQRFVQDFRTSSTHFKTSYCFPKRSTKVQQDAQGIFHFTQFVQDR